MDKEQKIQWILDQYEAMDERAQLIFEQRLSEIEQQSLRYDGE
jgi:hypothetical protein